MSAASAQIPKVDIVYDEPLPPPPTISGSETFTVDINEQDPAPEVPESFRQALREFEAGMLTDFDL